MTERWADDPLVFHEESNDAVRRIYESDRLTGRSLQQSVAMSIDMLESAHAVGAEKYLREHRLDELGAALIRELLAHHEGESVRIVVTETKPHRYLRREVRAIFCADMWRLKRIEGR